ncbi:MAG: InlB B-repeat-containing protein, partial [Spirochaetaceae bacterium]|nr:InlB B-repeat-containing protein [Spirochaetaceae bacterium]
MNQKYLRRLVLSGFIFLLLSSCSDVTQSQGQLYRLVYLGNENTEGTPPASAQALPGTAIIVAVNSGNLTKTERYFAGWNTKPDGSGTFYKPGTSLILEYDLDLYAQWKDGPVDKTFYAVTVDNQWYTVNAEVLAENDLCIVYGDINEEISPEAAKAIADEYRTNIYPKITGAFGNISYMSNNRDPADGKAKISLLLLDIIDGAAMSGGYVAGYFDSIHMYNATHSNQTAMLFMDVNPGDPSKTEN